MRSVVTDISDYQASHRKLTGFESRLLLAFSRRVGVYIDADSDSDSEAHIDKGTAAKTSQQPGSTPTVAELTRDMKLQSRGTVHRYLGSLVDKGYLQRDGRGWRNLHMTPLAEHYLEEHLRPEHLRLEHHRAGSDGTQQHPGNGRSRVGKPIDFPSSKQDRENTTPLKFQQTHHDTEGVLPIIPLLGRIAAGVPIEAICNEDHLDLAEFFIGPDRYALRVTGDSMNEAGILDGDTVIVKQQSAARAGDIVVALIDKQEATLKRLGRSMEGSVELIPENSSMATMRYSDTRVEIQGIVVGQLRSY